MNRPKRSQSHQGGSSHRLMLLATLISLLWGANRPVCAQVDPYGVYLGKSDSLGQPPRARGQFRENAMQELGSSFYFLYPDDGAALNLFSLPGICYSLRYPWHMRGDDLSITTGTYGTIGLNLSSLGSYFMLQLPILTEVNLGRGSTRQNPRNLGISAGFGPEITAITGVNAAQVNLSYSLAVRFRLAGRPVFLRYGSSVATLGRGDYQVYSVTLGNSFF